jgi:pyridoxine 5-phosphate synthase
MAGVEEMVKIALKIKPDLVTLVPEKREELTTEGGLNVMAQIDYYTGVTKRLRGAGIKVSFFIDPDSKQVMAAHKCGADIVEIHTGQYSEAKSDTEEIERFEIISAAVKSAVELGLGVSAGHGLNYVNVKRFKALPQIDEYSIGHSIVARAVLVGLEKAVLEMIELVKDF